MKGDRCDVIGRGFTDMGFLDIVGQVWARYDFVERVAQNRIGLWATCCNKIAYDFGQHLTQTCFMKSDRTLVERHIKVHTTLEKIGYDFGWYDATRPKLSELARPRDHLSCASLEKEVLHLDGVTCRHSRKKFDALVGSPGLLPLLSEKSTIFRMCWLQ